MTLHINQTRHEELVEELKNALFERSGKEMRALIKAMHERNGFNEYGEVFSSISRTKTPLFCVFQSIVEADANNNFSIPLNTVRNNLATLLSYLSERLDPQETAQYLGLNHLSHSPYSRQGIPLLGLLEDNERHPAAEMEYKDIISLLRDHGAKGRLEVLRGAHRSSISHEL